MNPAAHKDELQMLLKEWTGGQRIDSVRLGHGDVRQTEAHEFALQLVRHMLEHPQANFDKVRDTFALPLNLSKAEIEAGASLAFAVLVHGWEKATHGFPDHQHIAVRREVKSANG